MDLCELATASLPAMPVTTEAPKDKNTDAREHPKYTDRIFAKSGLGGSPIDT